jgi:hypothetical protein
MKKDLIFFILLAGAICFINACKEAATTQNPVGTIVADATYYPVGDGTFYKYSEEFTDSDGIESSRSRSTLFSGNATIAGVPYQVQINTVEIAGQTSVSSFYFRKTDSGVFFFLDSTKLFPSIPDTLIQYLTIDSEVRLLYLPVSDNSIWTAFKINLNYMGLINFNPVEVTTTYDGQETLTLNLNSGNTDIETIRLKFGLKYQPDPSKPPQSFTAFGWLAKNIGFVKWGGNAAIIGAFTGDGVDFADTSSVVVIDIVDFNIAK